MLLDYDVEDFDLNITRLECKDAKNLLQVLTSLNLNITRLECKDIVILTVYICCTYLNITRLECKVFIVGDCSQTLYI